MSIRKIKLSDTQARVIGGAPLIGNGYVVYSVGRSTRATFRKLYELGLISQPVAGAALTLEGMNMRTSLTTNLLQRTFFISDVVSHNAYEIQPMNVWGTDITHINADEFCPNCERETPHHYDNCNRNKSIASEADIQRTEGVQRIMAKVNAAKADFVEIAISEPETFAITVIRIGGDENMHRTGCADIKRSQSRNGIWAGDPWDMTVTSLRDFTEQYWGDICTDQGPEGSPEWLAELKSLADYGKWHACCPALPRGDI